MVEEIARFVPHIVLGGLLLALVLFVVSLQLLRRGRTGPYWRLRRAAGQRGGQLFLLAVALFVGSLALAFFSGFAAIAIGRLDVFFNQRDPDALYGIAPTALTAAAIAADQTETAAATEALTPSDAALTAIQPEAPTTAPTPTPTPSVTATLLPTLPPTITPTPTITLTPSPTFETALKLGIPFGAREPGEDAVVRIAAADTVVSSSGTPVEPREIFEAGLRRIYLFASFDGMRDGVAWTRLLYRDGVPVQGSTLLWAMGEAGSTYFFFGDEAGYPPGEYRVELWLGNRVVDSFDFAIINPAGLQPAGSTQKRS